MIVPRLIERKRDGERLEPGEIRELVLAYAAGKVPDYQMAALLMADLFPGPRPRRDERADGRDARERKAARSLAASDAAHRQAFHRRSRRQGLAHSRSADRFAGRSRADDVGSRTRPHRRHARQAGVDPRVPHRSSLDEAEKQIARIGCAMIGQTDEIVPADRKLYALRDATATVEVSR